MDFGACLYVSDFPPPLSAGDTAAAGQLPVFFRRQRIEGPQIVNAGRGAHSPSRLTVQNPLCM